MIHQGLKKITLAFLASILLISCENNSTINHKIPESSITKEVIISPDSVKIVGEIGEFSVKKDITSDIVGVQLITFTFTSDVPAELQPITIKYNFPSIDVNGFWNPKISVDKINYYNSGVTSKVSQNAPILSFYNNALQNRITLALSDALNKSNITCYLKEEDVKFYTEIKLFHEKMPVTTSYSITLRIDTRDLPYYQTIDDVATWWAKNPDYKPMQIPDDAKKPMYSTWYSYHQNVGRETIVRECKIAKSLGCEAVIVDDGWQTKDGNRGYAFTGDWNPDRIPDMKGFVDAVHNEGMKFILWYSLPFMGEKAKNYPKFKGKYLRHWESQGTYVLDPRYPEVREYIIATYVDAINNWGLDGFKLDFIGWFSATNDTKLTKENGRDFASVVNATDALMTEITTKLTSLNPNILIEFRQPYIGPLMRKYGNMFRGVDAPNNAVANRVETTNLRILSQNTAVHSDMFIWRPEENVEQAALQILNILYSVPQLSVRLEEIPDTHLEMIKYWFGYWLNNKDILLDGDFIPSNPGANYPWLTAIKNKHQITTIFDDIMISPESDIEQLDIINAKATTSVVINLNKDIYTSIAVADCTGKIIYIDKVHLHKGITKLEAPPSGIISIKIL